MIDPIKIEKPCSLCAEPILISAKKCRHCDGYQGIWFFLNLGVPTLGLLVAFISVLSLSIPIITNLLVEDNSDVRVEFQNFENGTAYFVASNLGTRPGTVSEAYFDYVSDVTPDRIYLKGNVKEQFIKPGESHQLAFEIPCNDEISSSVQYAEDEGFGSRPISKTPKLNVLIIQFNGTRKTKTVEIDELSGIQAIADKKHECLQTLLRNKMSN